MYLSKQYDKETNHTKLMALRSKLQSLEESFKDNVLNISKNEIEKIKNNDLRSEITAWNWSRSFAEE